MKVKSESEIAQSCPTLHDLPGSSVHGIFQARVLATEQQQIFMDCKITKGESGSDLDFAEMEFYFFAANSISLSSGKNHQPQLEGLPALGTVRVRTFLHF